MNIRKIQIAFILVILFLIPLSGIEPPMVVSGYDGRYGKTVPDSIYEFNLDSMYAKYGRLTSCQNFAQQKYKDVVNYVTIAAAYEAHPAVGVYQLFDNLEFLEESPDFSGVGYEPLVDISKTRSRNIFHEVIYHMNKIAEFTGADTVAPHIKNGLYLKYANDSSLPGGVPVYLDSVAASSIEDVFDANSVCICEDPYETGSIDVCTACSGVNLVEQNIGAYRTAFYGSQFNGPGDLGAVETGAGIVSNLKEKLLTLLVQRANLETIWQERKEEILSMHPEDADIYGVADINQSTLELLEKLNVFRDVGDIQEIDDVTDGDILRPYIQNAEEGSEEGLRFEAIKKAQIRRFEELQSELRTKVRTTRFTDTPEATKLWNQHYMNTRYYLDSFTDDMRGAMDQDVRQKWYPNGETEYLIETVLSQIDERIATVLVTVTGKTIDTIAVPNCIDSQLTADITVCDYDPAWFLKEVGRMIRPGSMETSYKECVDMTKNDSNAFGADPTNETPGILESMPNLWVYRPDFDNGWDDVEVMLKAIADGSADDEPQLDGNGEINENTTLRKMERILQEFKLWKKLYRKENNGLADIQEYFHYGENLWEYYLVDEDDPSEGYEEKCRKYEIDPQSEDVSLEKGTCSGDDYVVQSRIPDETLSSAFLSCFGSGETPPQGSSFTPLLDNENEVKDHWECFEVWMDAYTAYMEEMQSVQARMTIIEAQYKLLKAKIAAKKLKKSGMLDPDIPPADTGGDAQPPSKKNKNPFGIPSSLEKWFSNYLQFGVDDLNANFNFIAGLGVKNLVLDPNAYNPIQYLKNADAFIPHLGKAMLKYADTAGYEKAMDENPHKVEVASVILGQQMIANLENINKLGKMYEGVFEQINQFDPEKIKALFSGRGLKNLVDEEKILEIIGQELAAEAMTKIMAYGAPAGAAPIDARAILQALQRGSNISISDYVSTPGLAGDCADGKEECLPILQDIEMKRAELEGVVRAWESMIQGNANIIRTEIKAKYGAGEGLYNMVTNMVNAGSPLKGIINVGIKEPLMRMLIDSILNGAVPRNEYGQPEKISFYCGEEEEKIAEVSSEGDDIDELVEELKDCSGLSISFGKDDLISFSTGDLESSIKTMLMTVVDYKALLKTASIDIALDFLLNSFKVDANVRDMIKQILKTALNSKANLSCLPKIDQDGENATLKCGDETGLQIDAMVATEGLNLSMLTTMTRAIKEIKETSGIINSNGQTQLIQIADEFLKQIPMFKNGANKKLRLLTSALTMQVTVLISDFQNILDLVLNSGIQQITDIETIFKEKQLQKVLSSTVTRLISKAVTCQGSVKTLAEECGNQGGSDLETSKCDLDSIDSDCSINGFMQEISNIGANLNGDKAMPDIGGIIGDLDQTSGVGLAIKDFTDSIKSILEKDSIVGALDNFKSSSLNTDLNIINQAKGNSIRDNLNILVTAFKTMGIPSITPDFTIQTGDPETTDPELPGTPVIPELNWSSLMDTGSIPELPDNFVLTFNPTINFGVIKSALVSRVMELADPVMRQSDNVMELADLVTPGYWQGLIERMEVPEFNTGYADKISTLQDSLKGYDVGDSSYSIGDIAVNYNDVIPYDALEDPFTAIELDPIVAGAVAQDLANILIDPQFYTRVMKRLTDEIGIISTFKEIFNGVKNQSGTSNSALEWLLADNNTPSTALGSLICGIPKLEGSDCSFSGLKEELAVDGTSLTKILATAVAMRIEEIFMKELLKIPYGEVCAHHTSGLHLFGFDADLLEATFYVTTRLQKDKYGRLIDLENVNPKSREAFSRRYEGKVEKFKPYTKYYFFAQNVSFDDLAASAIEAGKNALQGYIEEGVAKAEEALEDKLAEYADEVSDAKTFQSRIAKDPKLEQFEFANLEKGGTVNFQIGPVPAYVSFGIVFRAGMRYGIEYNAGWFRGITLGASAGPYIVLGAYFEVGVGFDYEWLSVKIGVWGAIDVFDFYAPLKVQGMLKPELSFDGLAVKFYLLTSLEPELYLLAGRIAFAVSGRIGIKPLAISFSLRGKIFEWDPLIKKKFGNIIPLKPLDFDLFSIGRGIKVMGNEVATF